MYDNFYKEDIEKAANAAKREHSIEIIGNAVGSYSIEEIARLVGFTVEDIQKIIIEHKFMPSK